jgi:hypothetical protein
MAIELEREIPKLCHSWNGKAVAGVGKPPNAFAGPKDLPMRMSFFSVTSVVLGGFAEDYGVSLGRLPPEKWLSADEGKKTAKALIDEAEMHQLHA